jgi:hypothetical protein
MPKAAPQQLAASKRLVSADKAPRKPIMRAATSTPQATCSRGSSNGRTAQCGGDRLALLDGMAAGFFKQSMVHATGTSNSCC